MKINHLSTVTGRLLFCALLTWGVLAGKTATATDGFKRHAGNGVASVLPQQTHVVKGQVKDKNNETIIGVNVVVKGTSMGTATDIDGNYTLEVPPGAVLQFSFIGYLTKEVTVGDRTVVDVVLEEDTKQLEEVVVVGYGTQKKESLTGAMQVVKEDKLMDMTTPSVENLLSGKAPGVYVNTGSGQPGSAGSVVIRGKATINGSTDPLWVIDGVIVGSSAGNLNPADIASISVLKDAASTAIYGSMGANGVIVVTTKKGKTGKATIDVSAKVGISQLNNGNFEVMNGAELYDYYKSFSNQDAIVFSRWNEKLRNDDFSWWDEATQLGFAQDYNVSISGGSETLKTYTSVGVYDEDGAIKGYDFTKYNFRFTSEYQANDWLKVKPQFWGARRDIKNRQHSVDAMYLNLPWDSPYGEKGELIQSAQPQHWVAPKRGNYLYNLQWNYSESTSYELMANFDFDIKLTPWLTFSSVNNYKYGNTSQKLYTDPRSLGGQADQGLLEDYKTDYYRVYTNQLLRFNKVFADKHVVSAILAYEWNTYTGSVTDQIAAGFAPGFEVADVATTPKKTGGSKNEWKVQSVFMNANYAYDNKYLLQVSVRRDGASNFGADARYGNFFSVSGGWNINRESFFRAEWVDNLKLRASYGTVGSRPGALYPQYALYSVGSGYNGDPGAMISQVENRKLTWEKTYTTGVGVDATLFNRVNINMDYYYKKTTDLLYAVPVSAVTGVTSVYRNVGSVKNRGFEASASVDVIKTPDWNWNISANIALNRNEVSELYGDKQEIIHSASNLAGPASKIFKPGYDMDTWYTQEWAGVDPETGSPLWYKTDDNGARVTTSNYAEADQVILSASTPDFYGGFSTYLSWKDLDLSATFGYSVGGEIYHYSRMDLDADGANVDRNQMKLHKGWSRWEKPGDRATHPKAVYGNTSNSNATSSRYLEDASYLRLRNLTIGYNIPLKKYVSRLRVFASGENLFVSSDFSGIDPEIGMNGVANVPYPQTRKFMFGVNVTF